MADRVTRTDFTGKFDSNRRTPQGGLKVPAYLTRTGVLTYRQKDGSVVRELRHPEEVFKADSLASLAGAPVTIGHPGKVAPENWAKHSVGHVGDEVRSVDDKFVSSTLRVQDAKAVAGVEKGDLLELSCGYDCDVVPEPGEYNGEKYDARQTNISYNHVALLPKNGGRAGNDVRLRLDGSDGHVDCWEGQDEESCHGGGGSGGSGGGKGGGEDKAPESGTRTRTQASGKGKGKGRDLHVENPDGSITTTSHPSKAAAHRAAADHLSKNGGTGKLVITDPGNSMGLKPLPAQLKVRHDGVTELELTRSYHVDEYHYEHGDRGEFCECGTGTKTDVTDVGGKLPETTVTTEDTIMDEATKKAHQDALDSLQKQLDTVSGERDALKKEVETLRDPSRMDAAAEELASFRADAKTILGDADVKGPRRDVMIAALTKCDSTFKADGLSEEYLRGAFAAEVKRTKAAADSSAALRTKADSVQSTPTVSPIEAAQKRNAERSANAWQIKKDGK